MSYVYIYITSREDSYNWYSLLSGSSPYTFTLPGNTYSFPYTHDWRFVSFDSSEDSENPYRSTGDLAVDSVFGLEQSLTLSAPAAETGYYYFKPFNVRVISSKITYLANEGTGTMTPSNVTYNTTFTFQLNGFTRAGHTFSGWHFYQGTTRVVYIGNSPTRHDQITYADQASFGTWTDSRNYNVVAQWTLKTSTITYNGNQNTGGTMTASVFTYNSTFTFQNSGFTRTGYDFKEWYLYEGETTTTFVAKYNTGQIYTNWDKTGEKYTAQAQWTAKTYEITIDKSGGEGTISDKTSATYGSPFTFPSNTHLTKTGYTFSGWWLYKDNSRQGVNTTYNSQQAYGNWDLDGTTFSVVAQWTLKTSTITYNGNQNTGGTMTTTSIFTYNSTFTFQNNDFTRTGYTFKEWHLYEGGNNLATYTAGQIYSNWDKIGTNYTAKAQWTAIKSTIAYIANGGEGTLATNPQVATYDSPFTFQPNNFTRTGYKFKSWNLYEGENFIEVYSSGQIYGNWDKIGTNYTAKAYWTAKSYTIEYSTIEGTGNVESNIVNYDSPFTFQNNGFTRTGYEFSGWHLYDINYNRINTKRYGPTTESYSYGTWDIDKNVIAIAQWTAKEFTVTFDANGKGGAGGTGGTIIIKQNYNTTVTCPTIKAIGYVFGGWATTAASTTVDKAGGATFTLTENKNFVAIWTENTNGTRFSELQTVLGGTDPIEISEYRTQSGQTIANSVIRLGTHLKSKSKPIPDNILPITTVHNAGVYSNAGAKNLVFGIKALQNIKIVGFDIKMFTNLGATVISSIDFYYRIGLVTDENIKNSLIDVNYGWKFITSGTYTARNDTIITIPTDTFTPPFSLDINENDNVCIAIRVLSNNSTISHRTPPPTGGWTGTMGQTSSTETNVFEVKAGFSSTSLPNTGTVTSNTVFQGNIRYQLRSWYL